MAVCCLVTSRETEGKHLPGERTVATWRKARAGEGVCPGVKLGAPTPVSCGRKSCIGGTRRSGPGFLPDTSTDCQFPPLFTASGDTVKTSHFKTLLSFKLKFPEGLRTPRS